MLLYWETLAVGRELAVDAVGLVITGELRLVDGDAETGSLDPAPARAVDDGEAPDKDIVLHHLRGLLMAGRGVGHREHEVLTRRRGKAELAVGMLAHQQALEVSGPGERVEPPDGADPIGAETEIIAATALDDAVGICGAPESLVGAERHRHASLK